MTKDEMIEWFKLGLGHGQRSSIIVRWFEDRLCRIRIQGRPVTCRAGLGVLGANRGLDALSGDGSCEGQRRFAFLLYRQENIHWRGEPLEGEWASKPAARIVCLI